MQVIPLNGAWRVHAADGEDSDSIPATVPGCVHTDLMAAGRIPDPFVRRNVAAVQWVAEKDWVYTRSFEIDAGLLSCERVELVCDGLDTFATIELNGREVARTENAFHEHVFDVKDALRAGTNAISLRFDSSDRISRERETEHGELPANFFSPRPYARKPQYATGWDWGPVLPSAGIGRDIGIRAFSSGRIDHVYAPVEVGDGEGRAHVAVELVRTDDEPLTVDLTLSRAGQIVATAEGRDVTDRAEVVLIVKHPYLWWPAGSGDSDLYDLSVRLRGRARELDCRELRVGFRTVELERTPDDVGESFLFKVNGRRVYCKGSNWIPADSFPARIPPERYRTLLEMAVDQNQNMIRVWGGGLYEPDLFYDLCDELGLMVWQDFLFACAEYPDLDWFRDLVAKEAEAVVKRLRNHAALVLWCGDNENHWGHQAWGWPEKFHAERIYHEVLPGACGRLDPGRTYWPGSPFGGPKASCDTHGDTHNWSVWHRSRDYDVYRESRPRFVSEFGFQSFPTPDTVLEFAEPEDLSMDSKVIAAHQRCPGGNERLQEALGMYFSEPENFERLALFTQIIQGEAMKTGIEHWRRLKWHNAGALYWQLNDCWPAISWATVDYRLRPKPAHYYARRAFAPVLLTAHVDGDDVVVSGVNDTDQLVSGTADVERFDLRGEAHLVRSGTVFLEADGAGELCRVPLADLGDIDRRRSFLWLTFYSGIHTSAATLFFERVKNLDLTEPDISVEFETDEFDGQTTVRLTAPVFVKGVWLSVPGTRTWFSDNAFDLVPYVPREVTVDFGDDGDGAAVVLEAALKIQHCNPLERRGP